MTCFGREDLNDLNYPCFYLDQAFNLVFSNEHAQKSLPLLCVEGELMRRIYSNNVLRSNLQENRCASMLLYDMPTPYQSLILLPIGKGYVATLTAPPHAPEYPLTFSEQLRDPLAEIFATLPMLATHLDSAEDDTHLRRINSSCYRMLRSTTMLNNLTRISLGTVSRIPIDFSAMASTLCSAISSLAHPGTAPLISHLPDFPLIVLGEPELLSCLLENLISNALRFTRDGNEVTVSLSQLSGRLLLRVEDLGAGIRPEVVPHIFDTYYSASVYPDGPQSGLGLGLPFVHLLATAMGGSVSVESVYGHGTTVAVALPLAREEEITEEPLANFVSDYLANRYSSLFVELSEFCQLPEI